MRSIIDVVGPFTLRPERNRFWMLVRSIISQQISLGAARSIRSRLQELVAPAKVTPDSLLRFNAGQLRTAGISPQKARYLLDLAEKAAAGTVNLRSIGRLSDEAVITELTKVKGIGRWTAQMFLIFALGRPDVLPHDDLGVRTAIRDRYALDEPARSGNNRGHSSAVATVRFGGLLVLLAQVGLGQERADHRQWLPDVAYATSNGQRGTHPSSQLWTVCAPAFARQTLSFLVTVYASSSGKDPTIVCFGPPWPRPL